MRTSLACVLIALALVAPAQAASLDLAKVVGPERCAECHKKEFEAWQETHHAKTLNEMHRRPHAQAIASQLGIGTIKRDSPCLECHYTQRQGTNGADVIAGISCESCHGAARDWIDVHADYGGKGATREGESAPHKAQRIAASEAKGMHRPDDVYGLVRQCYECHNVPQEKLVNVGGHQPGSAFELISWLSGEVRHNYLQGPTNREDTPERRRVLYVLGQGLALETNLRHLAPATEKATFAVTMARRVADARDALKKIDAAVAIPEVKEMLAAAAVDLKLGNREALERAADRVGAAAKKFAVGADGTKLAAVDPLIPGADRVKGKARP